ncbi:helix-turn-helix transcriptional regulator [Roseovarius aestuarii]|uniref:Bacterial regulatory proteins, luxR family n=1 Tax=Roseovarius aestuarii TaxID=475083 RepID=A0A1X7BXX7_9RHOB|nr:helix-turn-helix transcriptional regulator [Roseovarius aestuarii]SMC14461.1 Bacterial regulatory proteins, luxR family [Roseovarius aestuarii]
MVGAIAHWCEFLHKKATPIDALNMMAEGLGAEAIALSRVSREPDGKNKILVFDKTPGKSGMSVLDRSFARAVLGTYFDKPKPGSMWFKSMLEHDIDPALLRFHKLRNFAELVIIPLPSDAKRMDFIEIHYPFKLNFEHHALLNMVASTVSETWKNRAQGLVTDYVFRASAQPTGKLDSAPILSVENPARLSRAEYRVCLMLCRGQTLEKVQEGLHVSMSTLRTHLRNIYAKTGTRGHAELMFHLLTFSDAADEYIDNKKSA